jgi:hypothetical protein
VSEPTDEPARSAGTNPPGGPFDHRVIEPAVVDPSGGHSRTLGGPFERRVI